MADSETKKIWITGAGGLIGNYLVQCASTHAPEFEVRALTRSILELTDAPAVERLFRKEEPDVMLHCAAMSRNPQCDADPGLAHATNVGVTRHLAKLASDRPFYFLSTDLVFDGNKGGYRETDSVNPISVYGRTKALAEESVLENERHAVIRCALNFGRSLQGGRAFNEQMRSAWKRGERLRLYVNEFRNPIHAGVTARAIWELIRLRAAGLFHLAGDRRLSRYEIGLLLAEHYGESNARIEEARLEEHQGSPRPPDVSLDCAKIRSRLSFDLPGMDDWLKAHPGSL